jgi:predicted RNA methylase
MYFKSTPYHKNLLNDLERIAFFQESLKSIKSNEKEIKLCYDLGCGSGILSYLASQIAKNIISIDKDSKIVNCAKKNLKSFSNIEVILDDIFKHDFKKDIDLIICEMLDTALIDEEQVPVLNHILQYLSSDAIIIPDSMINIVEPVNMDYPLIHYEDVFFKYDEKLPSTNKINYQHDILGDFKVLNILDFYKYNDLHVDSLIKFKMNANGIFNGIKITSFAKFRNNILIGPTPMLNPPLFIPSDEIKVKSDDEIFVRLKYIMGKGLETIKLSLEENNDKK